MRVALIGTRAQDFDYLDYCEHHGIEVQLVDPVVLRAEPQRSHGMLERYAPDDVVGFADPDQPLVDGLKQQLGLRHRPPDAVALAGDKLRFKRCLQEHGCGQYVIDFLVVDGAEPAAGASAAEALGYPLVLKPSRGFYSSGVVRVDGPEELAAALRQVKRVIRMLSSRTGPQVILAERYIDGDELAIDGFITDEAEPLVLYHKRPRLEGPTFHESCYLAEPFTAARYPRLHEVVVQVLAATGLRHSPFHAELRVDDAGRIYVLEVAPRVSGGGPTGRHLLELSLGLDAYALLHAVDQRRLDAEMLRARHERWAVEYDFCVDRSGRLTGIGELEHTLQALPHSRVLRYKDDGDYVLGPPLNLETILTLFCAADDGDHAQRLYDRLRLLRPEVV